MHGNGTESARKCLAFKARAKIKRNSIRRLQLQNETKTLRKYDYRRSHRCGCSHASANVEAQPKRISSKFKYSIYMHFNSLKGKDIKHTIHDICLKRRQKGRSVGLWEYGDGAGNVCTVEECSSTFSHVCLCQKAEKWICGICSCIFYFTFRLLEFLRYG